MSRKGTRKNGRGQSDGAITVVTKIMGGGSFGKSRGSKGRRPFKPTRYKPVESWHHGEHSANVGVLSRGDVAISSERSFPIFGSALISRDDFEAMLVEQGNRLIEEGRIRFQDGGLSRSV